MKSKKKLAEKYIKLAKQMESEESPNQFLTDGRLMMIEDLISSLDSSVKFDDVKKNFLRLCVALVDSYRIEVGNVFCNSNSEAEEIPPEILRMLEEHFNVIECKTIARNLSSIGDSSRNGMSSTQVLLIIADLFFLFQGPEAYERGIREHPSALDENVVIRIGLNALRLAKKNLDLEYFRSLLDSFKKSSASLAARNPAFKAELDNSLGEMRRSSAR